ncbi:SAM-dependent methyltransferase [Actinospica sp. MGRD01-02]|uniref:SAM-dependent methyltransferase n=1 Tax=Actinospica acidithermotolerans TaxID=2828514 RepID=A0A941IIF5_9ACTN|nr:SAM-dependent methyltransferase [Actinospica acidithermotolerans]MBR7829590.1 SAM-dependent methyltransferase [Actinospica acidithermotolerans]
MDGSPESEFENTQPPAADWSLSIAADWDPPEIDPTVPHPFRMYNYLIGGKDNYQADRDAVEVLLKARPDAVISARSVEAFSRRVVRYLVGKGITQFLQLGTAITVANSHDQIAQDVDPTCRFVYVADDPITLAHARALLVGRPGSDVTVVAGDFRAPRRVLADAKVVAHLDLDRPVGVLLFGMLDYIRDPEDARNALAALFEWLPEDSMVAFQHVQEVGVPEIDEGVHLLSAQEKLGLTPRTEAQVAEILRDYAHLLIEPGMVQLPLWRRADAPPEENPTWDDGPGPDMAERAATLGGVLHKKDV